MLCIVASLLAWSGPAPAPARRSALLHHPLALMSDPNISPAAEVDAPVEHRNVPQEHRGLHDTLYGDDDDHGASSARSARSSVVEIDGSAEPMDVDAFAALVDTDRPVAAVYALLDGSSTVRYVGRSRDVASALDTRRKIFPEVVQRVRAQTFAFPRREAMESLCDEWIGSLDYKPEGNDLSSPKARLWQTEATPASPDHETRKFKLRKAMADSTLFDEDDDDDLFDDEDLDDEDIERMRRERMRAAVEQDDWSAEINAQDAEVRGASAASVVSPFAADGSAADADQSAAPQRELTVQAVDQVLDEVRPYLIADGGNIEVVSVDAESGAVKLALQGACTSCPSASVTMTAGVESTLKRAFPSITSVENVAGAPAAASEDGAPVQLTIDSVEEAIAQIRPAIEGMGGSLRVLDASPDGIVQVAFKGPQRVQYGVDLALRDNKLVRDVIFTSPSDD